MTHPTVTTEQVLRLWFHRQGLSTQRGSVPLTTGAFVDHLERTGGLQLDSVNVLDRAHYLTLWSRFGAYDREEVDRWCYEDLAAFEYWAHEACLRPMSHLPLALRRMRRFPPKSWTGRSWWTIYRTSAASKRRVLKRLREEGPLESADFEGRAGEAFDQLGGTIPLAKEDKRSLKLLWHAGRVAVRTRRHFRCVYDLAERVLPEAAPASPAAYDESWLTLGLSGNGITSEGHLINYLTAPKLGADARRRVVRRALKAGRIVEVGVTGLKGRFYALPEHLEEIDALPAPEGTTLLCPFDSFLWQRERAELLLDFRYRVEIYVPKAKREFGYYVLPLLHDGRLVGRVDPKLHRDRSALEIRAIHTEDAFKADRRFERRFGETLHSLREFVGAEHLELPASWARVA